MAQQGSDTDEGSDGHEYEGTGADSLKSVGGLSRKTPVPPKFYQFRQRGIITFGNEAPPNGQSADGGAGGGKSSGGGGASGSEGGDSTHVVIRGYWAKQKDAGEMEGWHRSGQMEGMKHMPNLSHFEYTLQSESSHQARRRRKGTTHHGDTRRHEVQRPDTRICFVSPPRALARSPRVPRRAINADAWPFSPVQHPSRHHHHNHHQRRRYHHHTTTPAAAAAAALSFRCGKHRVGLAAPDQRHVQRRLLGEEEQASVHQRGRYVHRP